MRAPRFAAAIVPVLGLAGCNGSSEDPVMPDVMGQRLDVALSDIEHAGFTDEVEVLGGGVFGVVDKSNWQVCDQSPAAGQAVTAAPRLTVDRSCGDGAPEQSESPTAAAGEPSGQASEEPEETHSEPPPTESEAEEILTVEDNEDFAALLTLGDYCSDTIADFAAEYSGRTIQFDGNIGAMNNNGDYNTRYDISIGAGDFSETSAPGPAFQFRNVNTTSDLHLTGSSIPDTIGVGDNLQIIARVKSYESTTCLFLLEPVSTEFR